MFCKNNRKFGKLCFDIFNYHLQSCKFEMIKCNHDQIVQHFKILKYRRKWSCYEWQREFSGKLLSKHCVEYLQPKYKIYHLFIFSKKYGGISFFDILHLDESITQIYHCLLFDIPLIYPLGLAPSRVYQTARGGTSGCCRVEAVDAVSTNNYPT